jgi:surfeit locus 1 family protein
MKLHTTLILLALPVLFALGVWQLHRADFKRELQSRYETRRHAIPLTLQQLSAQNGDLSFLPITLSGHYDNAHPIFIGNKIYHHMLGAYVVMPFFPTGSHTAILVNRGWVPQQALGQENFRDASQRTIIGLIQFPQKYFILGQNIMEIRWPLQIQQLDIPALSQITHHTLAPFVLLLSPESPSGFIRDWTPVNMRPEMHIGYAVQWFAMFALLLIFCLWQGVIKKVGHD